MKLNNNALSGFGKEIDLMNTINGGISATSYTIHENEEGYIVKLRNPALQADSFHLELNIDHLTVYTTLPNDESDHPMEKEKQAMLVPTFLKHFPIPANVNAEAIEAVYQDGSLSIFAPFREDIDQYPRRLDIEER